MKRTFPFLIAISIILLTRPLYAEKVHVTRHGDLTVLFDPSLRLASREVVDFYGAIKADLERIFGWELLLEPTVLLIKEGENFQMMTKNPLIVAFAVPGKNLIVIDHSKMNVHPFSLELTLKHELCHLLLHNHLGKGILPKWLDEGVCQWVSSGIGEIIMDQKRSFLNKATLGGTLMRLNRLQDSFPSDRESLLLAYEESKSIVDYIIRRYGKESLLSLLERMKQDESADEAILKSLSISSVELEKEWHDSLRRKMTWFTYLSYHLYEILFAVMALISVYAFIKVMMKKRAYKREETEEDHLY
jgi:hypothetical protein